VFWQTEQWEDLHLLYGNRSICYLKLKQVQDALQDADECIRVKPDWATGYARRGDALQQNGELEMARLAYLQGLKLNPTNANLKGAVVMIDRKLGLDEDAVGGQGRPDGEVGDGFVTDDDEEENLYQVLGIEKSADDDEIRKAYRSMSRRWHPDKNPGDVQAEHMSRLVNHAYIVLTSPVKRRAYDRYGAKGLEVVDQLGEEVYEQAEGWEPYACPIMCCICVVSIPTLCCCCCCCNCCCGYFRKDLEEEYMDEEEYDDLETGRTGEEEEGVGEGDELRPPGSAE